MVFKFHFDFGMLFTLPSCKPGIPLNQEGYYSYVFSDQRLSIMKRREAPFIFGEDGVINGAYWLPYQLQLDPDGNITGIKLCHCPIGNDYPIFQEIAPYVREKSFILFSGEGQEAWKWIFENGKCRKVVPQIIWGE